MYDDYTTKGHGVIDGPMGGRKGKVGALYSKVYSIPPAYNIVRTVAQLNELIPMFKDMQNANRERLLNDLLNGYIIKVRGPLYIKYTQMGRYNIYSKAKKANSKSITRNNKNNIKRIEDSEAYRRLLRINQEAKNKKHNSE